MRDAPSLECRAKSLSSQMLRAVVDSGEIWYKYYLPRQELSVERGAFFFSYRHPDASFPTLSTSTRLMALSILICSAAFGQGQGLSLTNYQLISQQTIQRTLSITYRADLVNTGTALEAVTATVTSLNPSIVQVVAGQDTLQFAPVPANSQVTSSNTFTLQIDNTGRVDFSQLQWTFQTVGILLPATVTVKSTVRPRSAIISSKSR
jgi:hypothetical protein